MRDTFPIFLVLCGILSRECKLFSCWMQSVRIYERIKLIKLSKVKKKTGIIFKTWSVLSIHCYFFVRDNVSVVEEKKLIHYFKRILKIHVKDCMQIFLYYDKEFWKYIFNIYLHYFHLFFFFFLILFLLNDRVFIRDTEKYIGK